ncbi:MAG: class II glutamine amidotransferase [Burkholderiales bacterium]|nr:MAG: class II glutamine amidotransferase [Burkholderiales bacterium]
MCRLLAYLGAPTFLSEHVERPPRSLIAQSLTAAEAKTVTQGDGVGIGWYGERSEPGLYREARPAWSDENLRGLCRQIRAGLFFAHVRAATGTDASRANCHPFAEGRHQFMHNGQIGGYGRIRRRVEGLIDDRAYDARLGTSDSEAIFLAALSGGPTEDPAAAYARVLEAILRLQREQGIRAPVRFAACHSDGRTLHAFRWASDDRSPSLYLRRLDDGVVVASEPYDDARGAWEAVPSDRSVTVGADGVVRIEPFGPGLRTAAAAPAPEASSA